MGSIISMIAVTLLIFWAIGFFAFSAGGFIHILLALAILAILFRLVQRRGYI